MRTRKMPELAFFLPIPAKGKGGFPPALACKEREKFVAPKGTFEQRRRMPVVVYDRTLSITDVLRRSRYEPEQRRLQVGAQLSGSIRVVAGADTRSPGAQSRPQSDIAKSHTSLGATERVVSFRSITAGQPAEWRWQQLSAIAYCLVTIAEVKQRSADLQSTGRCQ